MHSNTLKLILTVPITLAAAFTQVSLAQTANPPPPVVAYPNGSTTYVAPARPSTPATVYVAPAPTAATATTAAQAPTVTYVAAAPSAPAPATGYVAPAPTYVVPAAPATPVSAAGVDYDHIRLSMTPVTGYPTGTDLPSTSQELIDDAQQIRKELIRDIAIAHQDITIVPANNRITLYGNVQSEALRSRIEVIARNAGKPSLVTSELKVQR